MTAPTGRLSPTTADAGPRRSGGSWSGMTEVNATVAALAPTVVQLAASVSAKVVEPSCRPIAPNVNRMAPSRRNGRMLYRTGPSSGR